MIYLAWPAERGLQQERDRLQSEIEGREMRVYPETIGEYELNIRFEGIKVVAAYLAGAALFNNLL
jgi:hypothetical protein